MKVKALVNIESNKYGSIIEGQEVEVTDAIGNDWIKNKLANGINGEGVGSTKGETKSTRATGDK